jgi:hypothetical protein
VIVPSRLNDRSADRHVGRSSYRPLTVIPTVRAQEPYGNRVGMMGNMMSAASGDRLNQAATDPRPTRCEIVRQLSW